MYTILAIIVLCKKKPSLFKVLILLPLIPALILIIYCNKEAFLISDERLSFDFINLSPFYLICLMLVINELCIYGKTHSSSHVSVYMSNKLIYIIMIYASSYSLVVTTGSVYYMGVKVLERLFTLF